MQNELELLKRRLTDLEHEVEELRLQQSRAAINIGDGREPALTIRAHFGRVALERKPFVVNLEISKRSSRTLTPVRMAILLVLLMDLLERSERGSRAVDNVERVRNALALLSPDEEEDSSSDAVRVALYRAGRFIRDEFGAIAEEDLSFEVSKGILNVRRGGGLIPPERIRVEIETSDQTLSSFLDNSLATSPLARLRKAKAMYVPSGNDGQDRLLLELLDHEYPVKQTSIFYRPTVQGFPAELVRRMGVGENRARRSEVATMAYQKGRLHYTEILPRKGLWGIIERLPGRGLSAYRSDIAATDVIKHLDHLSLLIRSFPHYELVLTEAFLPFYMTTFEVLRPEAPERYTLFFQYAENNNVQGVNVFSMKDDAVYFSTHERIVQWLLSHPTTVRDKESVLDEIAALRSTLLQATESPRRYYDVSSRAAEHSSTPPAHSSAVDLAVVVDSARKAAEGETDLEVHTEGDDQASRRESSR